MERFHPGSATYHNANTLRLMGQLDVSRLQQALQKVVDRHEPLRTTFVAVDGIPKTRILPELTIALPQMVLQSDLQEERQAEAFQLAVRLAQEPFDLENGPLIRFSLIPLSSEDYLLVYVCHHMISDRWSLGILLREMAAFYNGNNLPELPLKYTDYVTRQRQELHGELLRKKMAFWQSHLGEQPPLLDLPTDHQRPPLQTFRGRKFTHVFPDDLLVDLIQLGKSLRASLFMVVLSAFSALLARYTHQRQLVIGTYTAGRWSQDIEDLFGLFINALALRLDFTGRPTFAEMVKCTRKALLQSHNHQDLPFEKLVDELELERDPSRSPLTQVAFNYHNVPMSKQEPEGLKTHLGELDLGVSRLDLTLTMRSSAGHLELCFEYNSDLFEHGRIESMMGHLQNILLGIIQDPQCPLHSLPVLNEKQRQAMVVNFNKTEADPVDIPDLYSLFRKQARLHPDVVAAECDGKEVTYLALDNRATGWARRLSARGIGPGHRVGILNERNLEMLIAVLACLQCGAAYVPLSPSDPPERYVAIIKDSGMGTLLTNTRIMHRYPVLRNLNMHIIEMDGYWEGPISSQEMMRFVNKDQLAYVMYTSGSTGKPKGVMVSQGSIINLLASIVEEPGFHAHDVLVAVTSLTFDISVLELLLPLVRGAHLVIATDEEARNPQLLTRLIASSQATVVQATPATWSMLTNSSWTPPNHLRMFCGGDTLTRELANQLLQNDNELYNLYGPTETTIWSAVTPVQAEKGSVLLGGPISNTQTHILDPEGQLVPLGVTGELAIGGAGLSRGYLHDPKQTATQFIPNPYASKPGSRLYLTGDLCRRFANGKIDFHGRLDFQIKLRGFRIELGEIEAALEIHEAVQACVVMPFAEEPNQLVAYVQPQKQTTLETSALSMYLVRRLPEYMVPVHYVVLDAFPMMLNGKIDRGALPSPKVEPVPDVQYPENDFELRLARIWERLLGHGPISVTDSFFRLGGYSLLAVRLFAEIEKHFDKAITLPTLFQHDTVRALAQVLQEDGEPPSRTALIPLRPSGKKPPLFCIRGLFLYQQLAQHLDKDQPVYGIYLESEMDALKGGKGQPDSVAEMASRYVQVIQQQHPQGPYYLAGASFGGILAMEMGRQLREQGETVGLVGLFDSVLPGAVKKLPIRWAAYHLGQVMRHGPGYVRERLLLRKTRAQEHDDAPYEHQESFEKRLLANRGAVYREAISCYKPLPYHGDLALFRAKDEEMSEGYQKDPSLGWRSVARMELEIHFISGDHLQLLFQPHVKELAQKLQASLDAAYQKQI